MLEVHTALLHELDQPKAGGQWPASGPHYDTEFNKLKAHSASRVQRRKGTLHHVTTLRPVAAGAAALGAVLCGGHGDPSLQRLAYLKKPRKDQPISFRTHVF